MAHFESDDVNDLVERARAGDGTAWTALVRQHDRLLHHVARRHGLDEHDRADVVQETWLIAMEKVGQLREANRFAPWLCAICRRSALKLLGRRAICRVEDPITSPTLHLMADTADIESELIHRDDLTNLSAAVEGLPQQQRIVIKALFSADFVDYATTAERLIVPIGTIGPTRVRAIQTLRRNRRLTATG